MRWAEPSEAQTAKAVTTQGEPMKHLILASLIGAALLSTTTASAQERGGPCTGNRHYQVHLWMSPKVQHRHVEALLGCSVDRWVVPGGYDKSLSVARCESSLFAWANNGNYRGIFQQDARAWRTRAKVFLRPRWFPWHWDTVLDHGWYKARANILMSILMAHRYGWGSWSCQ